MSLDYVRKLVSGKKARFIDAENAVNLDLVYGPLRLGPTTLGIADCQSRTASLCTA
jgi:hypothetical protein